MGWGTRRVTLTIRSSGRSEVQPIVDATRQIVRYGLGLGHPLVGLHLFPLMPNFVSNSLSCALKPFESLTAASSTGRSRA